MARPILIDCPYAGCSGKYLTDAREIVLQAGTGARVVLRCTRNPAEHDSKIIVEPFSDEEAEQLEAARSRGERLTCQHCGTQLEPAHGESEGMRDSEVEGPTVYQCSWCGARWRPPNETGSEAGERMPGEIGSLKRDRSPGR